MLSSTRPLAASAARLYASNAPAAAFPVVKKLMLPADTFKDRVAFVTGGGTGLGKQIATSLSQLGAKVMITSRKKEVIDATAAEIAKATGGVVKAVAADVRDPAAVKAALDATEAQLGLPTVIVNNAAGNFISPTERLSTNAFKSIMDIVLCGTFNVTVDVGKRLIAKNQGASFLSISTTYASKGSAFVIPSAAAKAGVEAITKSLAAEWGRYGMRFNAIAPGPIETKGAFSRLDPTGQFKKVMLERLSTGRMGDPQELANLATYILSDYASWMTGDVVTLDGGETAMLGGEFNPLLKVSKAQWDLMEASIRKVKGS